MSDCFSLPNAAELVKRLRATAKVYFEDSSVLLPAADAIEALLAENANLKTERDAAINDIPRFCDKCKHLNQTYCAGCEWEWRGVQDA